MLRRWLILCQESRVRRADVWLQLQISSSPKHPPTHLRRQRSFFILMSIWYGVFLHRMWDRHRGENRKIGGTPSVPLQHELPRLRKCVLTGPLHTSCPKLIKPASRSRRDSIPVEIRFRVEMRPSHGKISFTETSQDIQAMGELCPPMRNSIIPP